MIERPILMSGPLVRKTLADEKTVTRRIVTPQPEIRDGYVYWASPRYDNGAGVHYLHTNEDAARRLMLTASPYGAAGDRLWVRETWAHDAASIDDARARYEDVMGYDGESMPCGPYYRADEIHDSTGLRWIPSIHMPRWACRLRLDVVSVRVERLHDITEEDARAEGVTGDACADCTMQRGEYDATCGRCLSARAAFALLWDAINGKRADWKSNPFVWRIEFRRVRDARAA